MKIRAQLVLACFLLSVLPLSVIVIYSYRSSRSALESAYRKEADARTRQMDRRLATIRGDLQQRLAEVSALPMPAGATDRTPDVGNILMTMGDAHTAVITERLRSNLWFVPAAITLIASALAFILIALDRWVRDAPRDPDTRIDVMNRMIAYVPLLLALSTSSPFWRSRCTGLKGYRLTAYDELPRTGLPELFRSMQDYDRIANDA